MHNQSKMFSPSSKTGMKNGLSSPYSWIIADWEKSDRLLIRKPGTLLTITSLKRTIDRSSRISGMLIAWLKLEPWPDQWCKWESLSNQSFLHAEHSSYSLVAWILFWMGFFFHLQWVKLTLSGKICFIFNFCAVIMFSGCPLFQIR